MGLWKGRTLTPAPSRIFLVRGGDVAEQGHQGGADTVPAGVVLGNPDGIEAYLFGVFNLFHHFAEDAALGGGLGLGPGTQQKQGKLHGGKEPPC